MSGKQKKNYLDYVPVCAPEHSWELNEKKLVVIHVENRGFYNRLAQKVFKRPKVSHISLDEYDRDRKSGMGRRRSLSCLGLRSIFRSCIRIILSGTVCRLRLIDEIFYTGYFKWQIVCGLFAI